MSEPPADAILDPSASVGGFSIRHLDMADLEAVLEIERAAFSSPWPRQAFELAVRDGSILALGAVDDDLAGYVVACSGTRAVLVANLAVRSSRRRRGLGRRLLDAVLAWARDGGYRLVTLDVRSSNEAAICMYRDAGFEISGVRSDYYRDPPEDALTMTRSLGATPPRTNQEPPLPQ